MHPTLPLQEGRQFTRAALKSFTMANGGLFVMTSGTSMMLLLSADNWGSVALNQHMAALALVPDQVSSTAAFELVFGFLLLQTEITPKFCCARLDLDGRRQLLWFGIFADQLCFPWLGLAQLRSQRGRQCGMLRADRESTATFTFTSTAQAAVGYSSWSPSSLR